VQPSLKTVTDIITKWLNVGRVHTQKAAGTDVALFGHDRSVHSIVLRVRGAAAVKTFTPVQKKKATSCCKKPQSSVVALTFLTSSHCCKHC